jgi:hypothetical protein
MRLMLQDHHSANSFFAKDTDIVSSCRDRVEGDQVRQMSVP